MNNDVKILRGLTYKYSEIANSTKNFDNMKLHKMVNDLKPVRPAVLIDEIPWHEMNIDNELTLLCHDEYLRRVEQYMRRILYKNKYMPADMVIKPFIPVDKIIESSGIGISVDEDTIAFDKGNHIVSHNYHDILSTVESIEKIHNPIISYNKEDTLKRYNLIGKMIGDIIPVKMQGIK